MRLSPLLTALLLAIVLLLAATASRAEVPAGQAQAPSPAVQADQFLAALGARVALTPQETAALRPILVDQIIKRQALVRSRLGTGSGSGPGTLLALRNDLRALNRETETRMAAVLPPDKLSATRDSLEELRQQARSRLAAARQGG